MAKRKSINYNATLNSIEGIESLKIYGFVLSAFVLLILAVLENDVLTFICSVLIMAVITFELLVNYKIVKR
jgi:hypothetical protein